MILLLGELGASALEVGLAYSFGYLLIPLRIVAVMFIPYLGYKRQVIWSWGSRTALLLVPIGLSIAAPTTPSPWMVWLLVGSFFIFCTFRAVGCSSFFPWMYELLPERVTGKFFSMDQFAINTAGVIVLSLSSLLFSVFSNYNAFLVIYSLAILASVGAIFSALRIPNVENPLVDTKKISQDCLKLILSPSDFRFYLIILMAWFFVWIPYTPFKIYYLSEVVKVDESVIVIYMALQYLGSIIMAWLMKSWVDRMGVRPFFIGALFICVISKVYWSFIIMGNQAFLYGVVLLFFINGASLAMWQIAHHKYGGQLFKKKERAVGIALLNAIVGVVGGVSPIIWGFFLRVQSGAGLNENVFFVYFLVAAIVMIILFVPLFQVKETPKL